jgi:hypothetical protein
VRRKGRGGGKEWEEERKGRRKGRAGGKDKEEDTNGGDR